MTASNSTATISGKHRWAPTLLLCVICCLAVNSTAEGATVRDEFDAIAYGGNNGTATWVGDWVEFGEADGPSAGFLRASATGPCTAGNCMRLGIDGDNDNKYLWREVNLSGAGSATPTQGSYDSFTGNWFIGNLAVSATATLTIQASVNAGTGGSSITNTASISFVSQTDPNPGNDTDAVDINPLVPLPPSVCQVDPSGTNIEAENFTGTIDLGGMAVFVEEESQAVFNGSGYLRSNGGGATGTPVEQGKIYNIEFTTSGIYNVWMRGYATSVSTDSLFVGLNGTEVGAFNEGGSYNAWVWTNSLQLDGNQITVLTVGFHDFNAWIRENGYLVDGFYLTQGAETPSGGIPAGVPTLDPTACGTSLNIVKLAFWPDGTPIPTGATIPSGVEFKYFLYVNNPSAVISDVTVRDVLDPAFVYQAGTIRADNSLANCAAATCIPAEELAIFAAVDAAALLTDAADADVASYRGASLSVDTGDGNVANLQLDINGNAVWAILFSVKMP